MQVSEVCILGYVEATKPLDLDQEIIALMMVDKLRTYEEPFSAPVIESDFGELEQEGRMPVVAGEEVAEEVSEPFF